jgi:hypothetical protein
MRFHHTRSRRLRSREPNSGHSPPSVAPGCPPAGGCRLCSGGPPPPASRSSPCNSSRWVCPRSFGEEPFGLLRSHYSTSAGSHSSSARSPGPNAPGRAGAAGATAPTGYLPIGKSAAAATLSMAKTAAVVTMMIFTMLIPLRLDTRTVDRVTPQFAPASSSRAVSTAAFLILRRARRGALQNS